jgi:hypothetical protein
MSEPRVLTITNEEEHKKGKDRAKQIFNHGRYLIQRGDNTRKIHHSIMLTRSSLNGLTDSQKI